jgi:hypothetical protein
MPDRRFLIALMAATAAALFGAGARGQQPMPYSAAVAERFPPPAVHYDLPSLDAKREDFTSNDELAGLVEKLVRDGGSGETRIERLDVGRSQQGTPLLALRFSRGSTLRPTVALIGGQHGDEPAGTEALLVIARQLAGRELGAVLDKVDVLLLPRANPDGAELMSRVSAGGIDINRDHLLLRTPEAQAVNALLQRKRPVVVADLHEHTVVGRYLEKFNAVQRHDMLLQYATVANLPPALAQASDDWFRKPVIAALAAEGHRSEWYYTNPTTPGNLRLSMGGVQPDTGRNVNGLKHAVSLLLETRGIGIGRLHLARRVHSHVVAVRTVLQAAASHADALVALQRDADAQAAAEACNGRITVFATTTPMRREMLMLDPVTGADKPIQVDWDSALELRPLVQRTRPCGYWLAASEGEAVRRLRALGLAVHTFSAARTLQAEGYVERARGEMQRPDVRGTVADGTQKILRVQVSLQQRELHAEPGSHYLPLHQPLANLAIAALEPDTQSSYFANRLIGTLDAVARVIVPPPSLAESAAPSASAASGASPASPASAASPASPSSAPGSPAASGPPAASSLRAPASGSAPAGPPAGAVAPAGSAPPAPPAPSSAPA